MATLVSKWYGVGLELNHPETLQVLNAADILSTVSAMAGSGCGYAQKKEAALALALFAGYLKVMSWEVKFLDKGNGVYLRLPWTALPLPPTLAILSIEATAR